MFFSHDTLISLLASRHKLYVQLGLIEKHVITGLPGDAVTMRELIEEVERQIGDINRAISQFRGPIQDEAVLAAE